MKAFASINVTGRESGRARCMCCGWFGDVKPRAEAWADARAHADAHRDDCPGHGTPAGYQWHVRRKETACDACKEAAALARAERRERARAV